MPSRRSRRSQWRRTKNGTYTISLGERGYRVRLFENRDKGGMIYREVQLPGGRKSRQSLGTRDRARAEEIGRQIVAGLMAGREARAPNGPVPLGQLCDQFLAECPMFLDNTAKGRRETRVRLQVLRSGLGEMRDARTLSEHDIRQYEARRRAGGIRYGVGSITAPVRQRSIQADVKALKQVLNWGCSVTYPDGSRLLDRNPLQFIRVRGESDVARPITSVERFEATRRAMQEMQQRYRDEAQTLPTARARARAKERELAWIRAELGLVLLRFTGRRRGSIVGLQWADVAFDTHHILWRARYDKKGKTWRIPYPPELFDTLREFQRRLGAVGGYVFPRRGDPNQPTVPELLSQWIRKAEEKAGLSKLPGGTCHPYRRLWRSERGHLPAKAVAVAGGWSDEATMERCYNLPDEAHVLAVTRDPRQHHEPPRAAAAGAN